MAAHTQKRFHQFKNIVADSDYKPSYWQHTRRSAFSMLPTSAPRTALLFNFFVPSLQRHRERSCKLYFGTQFNNGTKNEAAIYVLEPNLITARRTKLRPTTLEQYSTKAPRTKQPFLILAAPPNSSELETLNEADGQYLAQFYSHNARNKCGL